VDTNPYAAVHSGPKWRNDPGRRAAWIAPPHREGKTLQPPPDTEALLDSLGAVVWEGDPSTMRFRFVSAAAERLLGHPVRDWIEHPDFFLEHVHPEDRDHVVSFCRRETAAGRDHEIEYRMLAADGRVVWVRDIVRVVCEGSRPSSSRGVLIDVSDRKRAEEALHSAEERLRSLVESAPVILFALDRHGVLTHAEGPGLDAIELKTSDLVGRHFMEVFPPGEDRIRRNLARSLGGDEFWDTVVYQGRSFDTHYKAIRDREGEVDRLIGVATDVTEREQAAEERRRLESQLLHAQRLDSLGVLAGGIAHDFNNLLMAILGSADLAAGTLAAGAPERVHVDRIRATSRRAADLTQQLLTYAGRSPAAKRPLELGLLVREMLGLLELSIPKRTSLQVDLAPDLPAVQGDPAQLAQVVLNLVTNAAEVLADESGKIDVRTFVLELGPEDLTHCVIREGVEPGRFVCLEVMDTGRGFDAATRSRIFDPFFSTKFSGRGLGLATVLGVARSHHGTVCVESEPGHGARFRVLLPCSDRAVTPAGAPAPTAAGWRGSGRVLVADDEAAIREIATAMLRRLGFDVRTAIHGRDAIEQLRSGGSGLSAILLDLTMPELSADEALREIRRLRPEVPVILMSGFNEQYACSQLVTGGHAAYLQKPFDADQLAAVFRTALAPRPTRDTG
jgi:PAS domain S-box-containing protein